MPWDCTTVSVDLALEPVTPDHYGQLVRDREVLPWAP
jgi:hypothetical protein